jgi:hypothetical protein
VDLPDPREQPLVLDRPPRTLAVAEVARLLEVSDQSIDACGGRS